MKGASSPGKTRAATQGGLVTEEGERDNGGGGGELEDVSRGLCCKNTLIRRERNHLHISLLSNISSYL